MKKVIYLLATTLACHTFFLNAQVTCPNLITNGDFEAGNIRFTSGLTLDCNSSNCSTGTYCVTTNFNLKCNLWPNFADHTPTGVGNFLAIDGATGAATNVWSTTVTATAGMPYTFSFWYASIYPSTSQSFDLGMMVNGTLVNTITVSQTAPNVPRWVQYTFIGTTPVNNPTIAIRQLTPGAFRDFGLDDIVFSACSSCWVPTITGNGSICQGASTILTASGGVSYQWNTGAGTAAIPVTVGGTYTVTVTDANGCKGSVSKTVVVNSPPTVGLSASKTNVTCKGFSNGKASFGGITGTSPLSYLWTSGETTAAAVGLNAGTHYLTITDGNGCKTVSPAVIITEPPLLSVAPTPTNVTTVGGSNGKISLAISGGTPNYSIVLKLNTTTITQSSSTPPQYINLAKGTYQYTVTDANGCVALGSTTVSDPLCNLWLDSVKVNVTCPGGSNGSIFISPFGGTAPYTMAWSNGPTHIGTTSTYPNLMAGSYKVLITDTRGCSLNYVFVLTAPPAIVIASTITPITTINGSDGKIGYSATGGTSPYTMAVSLNGTSILPTQTISPQYNNLSKGTYLFTTTDAKGCTSTKNIVLSDPVCPTINLSMTTANVRCFGNAEGGATVSATGGTTPYKYKWSNGVITATISAVLQGTYTVTVTDAIGCTGIATATITQPNALVLTPSQSNVTTVGGSNGSIGYIITGGTPNFLTTLTLNGVTVTPTQATPPQYKNLSKGTYQFTVFDANGCVINPRVILTEPSCTTINASTSATNVSCNSGSNGTATVIASGGTLPYSYKWSNTLTTSTINNLIASVYSVTVTDAVGCTSVATATVTQPSAMSVVTTPTNISTAGGTNGKIGFTISGGTPNYTTALTLNGTTIVPTQTAPPQYNNLVKGIYQFTVTDANACLSTGTVTLTEPSCATINASTSTTNVSCNGGSNGTATVTASGGTLPYSYKWNNNATTATINNLIAGVYSVTVTDAVGCTSVATATVTQPSTMSVVTTPTNISTAGGTNGKIGFTVSGGTPNYTTALILNGTTIVPTQTTPPQYNNLVKGTYQFTVTDANACLSTGNVTLTEPSCGTINASTSTTSVSCNGGSNGTATMTAIGGTLPYSYKWSNGVTTATINNLVTGIYSVTVTDAVGCTSVATATVTQPSALSVVTTPTNITTAGGTNGKIGFTISGGTPNYTTALTLSGTAIVPTQTTPPLYNNLVKGTYQFTVTDANGCFSTGNVTLTEPSCGTINASTSTTSVSCNGGSNGTATATAIGGTLPYSYKWNNNATTATINNLIASVYSVTVTDAVGCTSIATATVTQPSAMSVVTTPTNISTAGGTNGKIGFTISGGTPNYTTALTLNGITIVPTQTAPPQYNNLVKGTYQFTITDANACFSTGNVTLTEPSCGTINASTSTTSVSCNGGSNGTATATPIGGTLPYSYKWNNNATTATINNLVAGAYSVTVTDAVGCTSVATATVTQPSALSVVTTPTNISTAGGTNGKIGFTISGGTPNYTTALILNGTTIVPTQTAPPQYNNLVKGTYQFTVTDANACFSTGNVTLTEPSCGTINASTSTTSVSCNGGSDGTATATAIGGTLPYSYKWNNNATTATINNLVVGIYSVTVTDAVGCTSVATATVTQPSALSVVTTPTNITTAGGTNGKIGFTISGGTPNYTTALTLSGTAIVPTQTTPPQYNNLLKGIYQFTVTDANACLSTGNVTLTEPSCGTINASTSATNVSCNGGSNGTATATPSGGTLPYSYKWNNNATTAAINNLVAGIYSVTVTDAVGCTSVATATVTQPSAMSVVTTPTNITTAGGTNGKIGFTISGGTPNYTTALTLNGTTIVPTQTTPPQYNNLVKGTYQFTVTDANTCTSTGTVTINDPGCSMLIAMTKSNVQCNGGSSGAVSATATGGTAPYVFRWSNGVTTATAATVSFNPSIAAGIYTVSVTDAAGCVVTQTTTITEPAAININSSVQNLKCFGNSAGSISINITGGNAPYTYRWNNGRTTPSISGLSAGTYTITVSDTPIPSDAPPCTAVKTFIVTQPTVLSCTTTKIDVSTATSNDGKITLNVVGGTLPYTVVTRNSTTTVTATGTPPQYIYSNLPKGTYYFTITDELGCRKVDSLTLSEPICATEKANAGVDIIECGKNTTILKATTIQLPARVSGKWSVLRGGGNFANANTELTAVSNLSQGSNLFLWTLTDKTCGVYSKDTVQIISEPQPRLTNAYYTLTNNVKSILINCVEILRKQMTNPPAMKIYVPQLPANSGVVSNSGNESVLFNAQNLVGTKTVEVPLRVCSELCPNLCDSSKLFITVNIADPYELVVPKIFPVDYSFTLTLMEIEGLEWYPVNEMTIVNRWGETVFGPVVYKNKKEKQAWDGTKNGQRIPTGPYYYYITYLDNKILRIKRGVIYLIDKE